jgi:hypothetical protein
LSDGEYSFPPFPPGDFLRSVKKALRSTLKDLTDFQESSQIGGTLRQKLDSQRESLTRILSTWRKEGHSEEISGRRRQQVTDLREALNELRKRRPRMPQSPSLNRLAALAGGQIKKLAPVHLQRRVLGIINGARSTKVREYWATQRQKPTIMRLLDKFGFLLGVLSLVFSEYVLLSKRDYFWAWYAVFMTAMMAARVPDYRHKRWSYFLLDFCYFANLCCLLQVLVAPSSCAFFKVNFAFAVGPLCAAVILWRNSLVFHDHDKVRSVVVPLVVLSL